MKKLFLFFIIVFFGLSFDRLNIFKYCIISSVLHEFGHIVAYRISVKKWPEIDISPFGFTMKNNVIHTKNYLSILLAGPLVNLFLAIITYFLCKINFKTDRYIFMMVNFIIFALNMLPVHYLDGGQILYTKSALFNRYYGIIGLISMFCLSVMVYYFTDNIIGIMLFLIYFIINISNDI